MAERRRVKTLNVRMLDDELSMIDAMAEREGISISDWVRQTVRASYRKAFGETTASSKTTAKRSPRRAAG